MKTYRFTAALLAVIIAVACNKNVEPVQSNLEIRDIVLSSTEIVPPCDIKLSAVVSDKGVALSTLDVTVMMGSESIASKSIRTKGNEAVIENETISIPLVANMAEGTALAFKLEATNVEGGSVSQTVQASVKRPALPETIYMKVGEKVYWMYATEEDKNVFRTNEVGGFDSMLSVTVATDENFENAQFIWGASDQVNKASLIDYGGDPMSISFPSVLVDNYAFDAVAFEMKAIGKELNVAVNNVALVPEGGLLTASVDFKKGETVTITGLEDLDGAYNRDFFAKSGDKYSFAAESGTYTVTYSPKYNYIWVAKMDAVSPECIWILGNGFTCAPQWNADYNTGGWVVDNITRMACAPKIAEGKYQATLYLSDAHVWGGFEFETYTDLLWTADNGLAFSGAGDTKGIKIGIGKDGNCDFASTAGFQPGYYQIIFDTAAKTATFKRLTEWASTSTGIFINGNELEAATDYNFVTLNLTKGQEVMFSGFGDLSKCYNRDFFSYTDGKATFLRESGNWTIYYYPSWDYMWVFNTDLKYPDCIYFRGRGFMQTPNITVTKNTWIDTDYQNCAPFFGYAPKIAADTYQVTIFCCTYTTGWRSAIEIYSDLNWTKPADLRIMADASLVNNTDTKFALENAGAENCIIYSDYNGDFKDGYYRFTIKTSASGATVTIDPAN